MHPLELLLVAYGTVFIAELAGDKALINISTLATRLRPAILASGITLAFAAKMFVAVLAGQALARLPAAFVTTLSVTTFCAAALFLWLRKPEAETPAGAPPVNWARGAGLAFAAIFFTEWGDIGQISAAALVARYHAPLLVWLGATAAMVTKGALAMTLGVGLRRIVPPNALRYTAVALCLAMAVLAAFRVEI